MTDIANQVSVEQTKYSLNKHAMENTAFCDKPPINRRSRRKPFGNSQLKTGGEKPLFSDNLPYFLCVPNKLQVRQSRQGDPLPADAHPCQKLRQLRGHVLLYAGPESDHSDRLVETADMPQGSNLHASCRWKSSIRLTNCCHIKLSKKNRVAAHTLR